MLLKNKLCVLGLILGVMLAGCGGSDSGGGVEPRGIYNASYNRGQGTMVIGVDANGTVDVAIDDETAGFFHGSGIVAHNNTFSVNCAGPVPAIVTVTGTFAGSGAGRTVGGNVSGAFTVPYTANFGSEPSHTAFAGHYEGFYAGQGQGVWSGDVDSSGHFMGTWHSVVQQDTPLTGTVSSTGFLSFTGTSGGTPVTTTLTGVVQLHTTLGLMAFGTWSDSGGHSGTWEGGLANEG